MDFLTRWITEYHYIDGAWYQDGHLEWPWFGTGFDFFWFLR